jgi:hypothetical protein
VKPLRFQVVGVQLLCCVVELSGVLWEALLCDDCFEAPNGEPGLEVFHDFELLFERTQDACGYPCFVDVAFVVFEVNADRA